MSEGVLRGCERGRVKGVKRWMYQKVLKRSREVIPTLYLHGAMATSLLSIPSGGGGFPGEKGHMGSGL